MKTKFKILNFKLLKKNLGADIFGPYKSAFHGTGIEFAEHREYIPGDEIKHIDWKVSARTNKIYIKKYEEERNLNVMFLINLNPSFYQFPNKLQSLTETFFILGASAINNNDNIATFIQNKFLQRTKSIHILAKTIEEIQSNIQPEYSIETMLYKIKSIKYHLIFILTDEIYQDKQKLLKKLNLTNEVIYINIFEHFENYLEELPGNTDFKGIGENLVTINLENKNKIKEYQQSRLKRIESLKNYLNKQGIGYVYIDTKTDPYTQLYNFFRKRILAR